MNGRVWEFHRDASLNLEELLPAETPRLQFNQFGAHAGRPDPPEPDCSSSAPYEGHPQRGRAALAFQVETPELRDYVPQTAPNSVAAAAADATFPAPSPDRRERTARNTSISGISRRRAATIPAIGRATSRSSTTTSGSISTSAASITRFGSGDGLGRGGSASTSATRAERARRPRRSVARCAAAAGRSAASSAT